MVTAVLKKTNHLAECQCAFGLTFNLMDRNNNRFRIDNMNELIKRNRKTNKVIMNLFCPYQIDYIRKTGNLFPVNLILGINISLFCTTVLLSTSALYSTVTENTTY